MRASSSTRATPASGSTRVTVRPIENQFLDAKLVCRECGNLCKMSHTKNLIAVCKILQLPAHGFGGLAANAGIDFVENSVFCV